MSFVFAYVTSPTREEAVKIARHLVEKKLAACANIFPITGVYPWKGEIRNEEEFVMIAKTTEERFEEMKKEIEEIHSYDIPCIIKMPVEPNEKYAAWLRDNVG